MKRLLEYNIIPGSFAKDSNIISKKLSEVEEDDYVVINLSGIMPV